MKIPKIMKNNPLLFAAFAILMSASTSHAVTTVASYSFDAGPVPSAWGTVNSTTATVSGGVLQLRNTVSTGSDIVRTTLAFESVTLANVGDYLNVAYQIQLVDAGVAGNVWASASSSFRDLETVLWNSSNGLGYGGWLTTNDGNRSRLNEYTDVDTTTGGPGGRSQLAAANPVYNIGSSTTVVRDVTLSLLRTETGVQITYQGENNDGNFANSMMFTDTTSAFFTFDRLEIVGAGGNRLNFNLDNVVITTNIPEPSAALLGGLGLLALLRRKR